MMDNRTTEERCDRPRIELEHVDSDLARERKSACSGKSKSGLCAVRKEARHGRMSALALFAAVLTACALSACLLAGCQSNDAAVPDAVAPGVDQNAQTSVDSTKMRGAAKGQPAPDAPLTMLDGSTKNISDFQGGVTILSFWGTWCPYCIKEMPDLQKIRENYADVNVVLVNCGEDKATVADFAEQQGYDFVWALDPNAEAQRAYPTSGIPYTVVIDAEGTVSEIFAGSARDMYPKFEAAVQKAME
ncbi:MAG: redoxin family protein [Slackia sp.]|nr:redoxin family protein [Slackia sp.]